MDQVENWHTSQLKLQHNLAEGINVVDQQQQQQQREQQQQQQVHPQANSITGVGILSYIPPKEVIESFPTCFAKYYSDNRQKLWPQGCMYTPGSHIGLFASAVIDKGYLKQLVVEEHLKHHDKIQREIVIMKDYIQKLEAGWVTMNNTITTLLAEKGVHMDVSTPTPDLSMLSETDVAAFQEYFDNLIRLSSHLKSCQQKLVSEEQRRDMIGDYIDEIRTNGVFPETLYGNPRPLAICYLGDFVNGVHDPTKYVQDIVACNPGIGMKINFCGTGTMTYMSLPDSVSDITEDITNVILERIRIICTQYFATRKQHQNDVVSRVMQATKEKKESGGYSHFAFRDLANNETIVTSAETDEEAKQQIMNSLSGGVLNQKKRQTRSRDDAHDDLDLNDDDDDETMNSKIDKTDDVVRANAAANAQSKADAYNHQHQEFEVPILMKFPCVTLPCIQTVQGYLDASNRPNYVLLTYIPSHVAAFSSGMASNEAGLLAPISYSNDKAELDAVATYLQRDSNMSNLEFIVLQRGMTRVIPFAPALTSLHSDHKIKPHPLNDFNLKQSNNHLTSSHDMP